MNLDVQLTLKLSTEEINLPLEEARELYRTLHTLFGNTVAPAPAPMPLPVVPTVPWSPSPWSPWTCASGQVSGGSKLTTNVVVSSVVKERYADYNVSDCYSHLGSPNHGIQ